MSGRYNSLVVRLTARWLVPAVLVGVALVQHSRARLLDQSSWIGCGFGMFATLDNHTSRYIRARMISVSAQSVCVQDEVAIPAELRALETQARVVPTRKHLRQLGEAMWRRSPGEIDTCLELSLYHVQFDPQENRLQATPHCRVRVP